MCGRAWVRVRRFFAGSPGGQTVVVWQLSVVEQNTFGRAWVRVRYFYVRIANVGRGLAPAGDFGPKVKITLPSGKNRCQDRPSDDVNFAGAKFTAGASPRPTLFWANEKGVPRRDAPTLSSYHSCDLLSIIRA